jgi:hypothetical protein
MDSERLEVIKQARRWGQEVAGIAYNEWLAGPDGMSFELLPEDHHTAEDVKRAKAQLRRDRDVVSIRVTR